MPSSTTSRMTCAKLSFHLVSSNDYIKDTNNMNTVWTKPQATEMRFGFEVTMYVANR